MTRRAPGFRVRKHANGWVVLKATQFGWQPHSRFQSWAAAFYYANLLAT